MLAGLLTVAIAGVVPLGAATADEGTISVDTLRTGWDSSEPGLSGLAPTEGDFGKLIDAHLTGQIYAQPLVIDHSGSTPATVIVATESDMVYALNADDGSIEWKRSLGMPWPSATVGCGNITTQIGVTSTPVYDPATGAVYVMAKTNGRKASGAADPEHPTWRLHALKVNNGGKELNGWPVTISGYPDNDPKNPFNPKTNAQRPGLLLMDGSVYAGFASYCDVGPFDGYVAGVSTTTHRLTSLWATATGTPNGWGGVWQSGGGLVSDGPGRILLATGNGNGKAPGPGPGSTIPSNLSQSVVRLAVSAKGKIRAKDFFSPSNNGSLNADDLDLGSGGPLAVPKTVDGQRLLVQVGKDGRVFLLNRDNLGGTAQGPHGSDAAVDVSGPFNGVWGHPAYWGGPGNAAANGGYVYDAENQGPLRAFHLSTNAAGKPALTPAGTSVGDFGYTSGSPVVTSDGSGAGDALVWVLYTKAPYGPSGELRAYDALPHNGTLQQVYTTGGNPQFDAEKFTTPATDGNRIYFGTTDGRLLGFGEDSKPAVAAAPHDFGDVAVNTSSTETVTLTAARDTTIQSVTTHGPFSTTPITPPIILAAHQSMGVPVTFTPQSPGTADGDLTVTSADGRVDHLDLFGYGTQDGLRADPADIDFAQVPTGGRKTINVDIENTGTGQQTLSAPTWTQPHSSNLSIPNNLSGTVIQPGHTLAVPVTYAPKPGVAMSDSTTLTVAGGSGNSADVHITAHAITGKAALSLTPNPMNFHRVVIGTTRTERFEVRNTGNIPLTISKAGPPAGQFTAPQPFPEGTTLQPNQALRQSITYRPTSRNHAPASYYFNFSDGTGAKHHHQLEVFHGTGIDPIARHYKHLGGKHSRLGRPRGHERSVAGGRMRRYRHGRIYWSRTTGAQALFGPILRHYLVLDGPRGFAGFPTSDVHPAADRRGQVAHFAGDTAIYSHKHIGTFEVNGAIRIRWDRLGGVISRLGYPTSDEFGTPTRLRRSNFQHGHVTWNPRTHKTKVGYYHHHRHHRHHHH